MSQKHLMSLNKLRRKMIRETEKEVGEMLGRDNKARDDRDSDSGDPDHTNRGNRDAL